EGKHRFVILMILDYTAQAEPVPESGNAAYRRKFHLENGYPTYAVSAADVGIEEKHGNPDALRIDVPFPEGGPGWGDPPEVKLYRPQAARSGEAIAAGRPD